MKTFPSFVALAVAAIPVAAQPAQSPEAALPVAAPLPLVTLPLERSNYFIGETVPVALARARKGGARSVELVDERGYVAVRGGGVASLFRLPTQGLAAGAYQVRVNGVAGTAIRLASALRCSAGVVFDEALPSGAQGGSAQAIEKTLRESGINAIFGLSAMDQPEIGEGRYPWHDALAPTGTMLWINPQTRPMSFNPVRIYEPELASFRQRMVLQAQANARYPTFGGFSYDWDPLGFFGRKMLFSYWGWQGQDAALRNVIARSDAAVYAEFEKRTGLKAPSSQEYLRYLSAIGRPEFGSAFDLPTVRWMEEIALHAKPLPDAERVPLEKRLFAWSRFLMALYGETYAGHQKLLREAVPSLANTASVDNQAFTREGQWQESAYAPLDFRLIEAWHDQVDHPDYTYQWLFHAAQADMGRPQQQPVWVASALGLDVPYPGRFMRIAGHNLAYGGRGLGLALEAGTNIVGGMNTNWANIQGKTPEADFAGGRELLRRFAPLQAACAPVRRVAVLYSESQATMQSAIQGYGTPQFAAFVALARLGYTPRLVSEKQISSGALPQYRALVVVNQGVALPAEVSARIGDFTRGGGTVLLDGASTVEMTGAKRFGLKLPARVTGKPFNWTAPDVAGTSITMAWEKEYAAIAPVLKRALGEADRSVLAAQGDAPRVSTFELDGGADARYVLAVNDAVVYNQSSWSRLDQKLRLNVADKSTPALYDLTDEKSLRMPREVTASFQDRTVRVYGVLARPVARLGVRSNQSIGGTGERNLSVRVSLQDAQGKTLRAATPLYLQLRAPDGKRVAEFYRATNRGGEYSMSYPMPANAAPGEWKLMVRSLLDGRTVTQPISVTRAAPLAAMPVTDAVVVRDGAGIEKLLAEQKAAKRAFVLPVFDGPDHAALLAAAQSVRATLAARGIEVEIRPAPAQSIYTLGYDPDAAALAENARAESGESIGKIKVTTVNRNDYFSALSGYVFGRPVILLDMAGRADNEMAERLDGAGLLWPKAGDVFPGAGRATVQMVHSAFSPEAGALVIQASDAAGLLAGAKSLAKLPADWVSAGIAEARRELLRGYSIGATSPDLAPIPRAKQRLTANRQKETLQPQPLRLEFPGGVLPPAADAPVAPSPAPAAAPALPVTLAAKELMPYVKIGERWQLATFPAPDVLSDLRFSDAAAARVNAGAGGRFRVVVEGVFRFSDRSPRSQSSWEDTLSIYNEVVPRERRPLQFDVVIDGRPAGALGRITTAQNDMPVTTPGAFSGEKPQTVNEEIATRVEGEIELPAGTHEVLLARRNIVDGNLEKISIERLGQ